MSEKIISGKEFIRKSEESLLEFAKELNIKPCANKFDINTYSEMDDYELCEVIEWYCEFRDGKYRYCAEYGIDEQEVMLSIGLIDDFKTAKMYINAKKFLRGEKEQENE